MSLIKACGFSKLISPLPKAGEKKKITEAMHSKLFCDLKRKGTSKLKIAKVPSSGSPPSSQGSLGLDYHYQHVPYIW